MSISPGTRFGSYEVAEPIGFGGMLRVNVLLKGFEELNQRVPKR